MHASSFAKMTSFFRTYEDRFPRSDGSCTLLEVGSRVFLGQASYRQLVTQDWIRYVGLDLEPGENVDVVAKSGFVWPELEDASIGVCISGQTFEHNPFFWATMAEISRVLIPGGLACIIAPGAQGVHRFPVDCWRFYPDSWAALCALTALEPLEVYFETDEMALRVSDGSARDSMVIARKPTRADTSVRRRLDLLTRPFREDSIEFRPVALQEGPCVADYRRTAPVSPHWRARIAQLINPIGPVRLFRNVGGG
jgi:SAM-dependent methyltransferase